MLHRLPDTTQETDMFLRRTRRSTPGRLAALQDLESELALEALPLWSAEWTSPGPGTIR